MTLIRPRHPIIGPVHADPAKDPTAFKLGANDRTLQVDQELKNIYKGLTDGQSELNIMAMNWPKAAFYDYQPAANTDGGRIKTSVWNVRNIPSVRSDIYSLVTAVPLVNLHYDGQTSSFVAGETIHGDTSGAIATVLRDEDNGATGMVVAQVVSGTWVDNEDIDATSGDTKRAVVEFAAKAETFFQGTGFQLGAGTYKVDFCGQTMKAAASVLRLQDLTNATTLCRGPNFYGDPSINSFTPIVLNGVFTLTGTAIVCIEARWGSTNGGDQSTGGKANLGVTECFANIVFTKISYE